MAKILAEKGVASDVCAGFWPRRVNVTAADSGVLVASLDPGGWKTLDKGAVKTRHFDGARLWEIRAFRSVDSAAPNYLTGIRVVLWPEDVQGHAGELYEGKGIVVLHTAFATSGSTTVEKHPVKNTTETGDTFYEADAETAAPTFDGGGLVSRRGYLTGHWIWTIDVRGYKAGYPQIVAVASGRVEIGERIVT